MLVAQPRSDLLFWEMGLPLVANLGPCFVGGSSEGRKQGEGRKERGERRIGVEEKEEALFVYSFITSLHLIFLRCCLPSLFCMRAWTSLLVFVSTGICPTLSTTTRPFLTAETTFLVSLRVVSIS